MLTYTVYNQKGGQAKTTIARDLAALHTSVGEDVLVVDLDAQNASLSRFWDVDEDKNNFEADDLTRHLIGKPNGEFDDLIKSTGEGVDVLPSHKRLTELERHLNRAESYFESAGEDFNRYERLLQLFRDNNVNQDYDVIIVDPNAKADDAYYLSLFATRNVVVPASPSKMGYDSIDGVRDSVENMGNELGIDIGRLAVVATRLDRSSDGPKEFARKIRDDYGALVYFKDLVAFQDAEKNQVSVFKFLNDVRNRDRKSETDIIPKYRTVMSYIYDRAGRELNANWTADDLWTGDDFWGDVGLPSNVKKSPQEVS